jgi:hypothetical protein
VKVSGNWQGVHINSPVSVLNVAPTAAVNCVVFSPLHECVSALKAEFYGGELWKAELKDVLIPMLENMKRSVLEDGDASFLGSVSVRMNKRGRPASNKET